MTYIEQCLVIVVSEYAVHRHHRYVLVNVLATVNTRNLKSRIFVLKVYISAGIFRAKTYNVGEFDNKAMLLCPSPQDAKPNTSCYTPQTVVMSQLTSPQVDTVSKMTDWNHFHLGELTCQ